MRWARTSLLTALLSLAGCKSTEKPSADRDAPGKAASRTKGTGSPTWLDDVKLPGGGGPLPKADSWTNPLDSNVDINTEVRGLLAGVVIDPDGHRAGSVTIQIEPANGAAGATAAPMSIVSDAQGYFLTKGLKSGLSYTLTVRAMMEGRSLVAVQQTRVPNPNLTLKLRDDVNPQSLPPVDPNFGGIPGPATPGEVTGMPPPANLPSAGAASRPSDGAWSPGGATTAPLHRIAPSPSPTPTGRPAKPENHAGDPIPDWRAPAASIPTPALPALPPPITPSTAPADRTRSSTTGHTATDIALVDTMNRPWSFESRSGKLVLIDFMTTTCGPCKKAIPTLTALQSRYGAYGLQVIAVACDDKPQVERASLAAKYVRDFNLNYALYVEPGVEPGSVRDRFHVENYPTVILLNEQGSEVWRGHPGRPQESARLEAAIRQHLAGR